MTTLRDLLTDLVNEAYRLPVNYSEEDILEAKESLVDEYIEAICKRWVGQE